MIGAAFGRWVVLSRAANNGKGNSMWLCRCSCGTERMLPGIRLRFGSSNSCGCARDEKFRSHNAKNGQPRDLPNEIWRPVPGDVNGETIEVSALGRIRNVRSGHVYKPMKYFGYILVRIRGRYTKTHRLVALAFIPNPEGKRTVNHKNGVKSDNAPSNLEWATQRENIIHACATGLLKPLRGSRNGASKLIERDIEQIRRWHPLGLRQVDLADAFGVSQRAISLIVRKEKWRHV